MVIDVWSCELLGARGLFLPVRPCSLLSVRPIIKYHSFTICFRLLNESKAERVTSFPSELYLLVIKQCYWASFVPCVAKPASFPFYNCTIRAGALLSYISRPCVCVRVCSGREREGKIRCSQRLLKYILFSLAADFAKWEPIYHEPLSPINHHHQQHRDFPCDLALCGGGPNLLTVTRFIILCPSPAALFFSPSPKQNPVIYILRLNGPLFAPKAGEL